ncbi:MAG: hypothetical protein CMJ84_14360 [Planctomycetes bacterium]|jgi:predicted DNA-binding protein (UPF0251 family)|nr:hypothetical protein [Planctomycetota bacterium]
MTDLALTAIESDELTPERIEQCREALRLHLAGHSQFQIAAKMDVSRRTVCRLLSDYRAMYDSDHIKPASIDH